MFLFNQQSFQIILPIESVLIILILNCLFAFIFKDYISSYTIYYITSFNILICDLILFDRILVNTITNEFIYIDLGKLILIDGIIEVRLSFCFDNLALILSLVVLNLTALATMFGVEYMYREAFLNRLLYLLLMFSTSVILLFLVYDFFLILVAWELIGLFSFLLVNFYSQRIYSIKAAIKTFIFSRISDLFIFIAFILIVIVYNSTDLIIIFLKTPFLMFHSVFIGNFSINFLFLLTMLISLSGIIKAAQFFSHVWLPDAMEAPTPASALIHSSTLVIMGIYLIIRFSLVFEFATLTNYFLAIVGGLTLSLGAVAASQQNDIKKLVAYSTISQMGYLICGCGFCAYEEVLFYLVMHAVNKAFLFIIVGYTVHFYSANTDMRQMGGAYIYSFDLVFYLFFVSLNLISLPYTAGFLSKEFLMNQVFKDEFLSYFIRICWFVSFIFTPYYMFILFYAVSYELRKGKWALYSLLFDKQNNLYFKEILRYRINVWLINLQNSLFTTRFSTTVLVFFLFIFYFVGESLISLILNLTSPGTTIFNSTFCQQSSVIDFHNSIYSALTINLINIFIFIFVYTIFMYIAYMFNINNKYYFLIFDLSMVLFVILI